MRLLASAPAESIILNRISNCCAADARYVPIWPDCLNPTIRRFIVATAGPHSEVNRAASQFHHARVRKAHGPAGLPDRYKTNDNRRKEACAAPRLATVRESALRPN